MTRKKNNILLLLYLFFLVYVNLFIVGLGFVSGNSMEPNFSRGNIFLLKKFDLHPEVGDVVVTSSQNQFQVPLLKRVVATQGQVLSWKDGVLSVDGTPLDEYQGIAFEESIEIIIPDNSIFLIGDNHHFSKDSRDIGAIPLEQVAGILLFSEYYTKEVSILRVIIQTLGHLMNLCYQWTEEYLLSIVLFTLCTKIILLPVSLWVHKNAIKMIQIQPEINRIKTKHFGNPEKIAEEQSLVFKKVKYNPLTSLIPLLIQIGLLISVIEVIYQPLTYLLDLEATVVEELAMQTATLTGLDATVPSFQISILHAVQSGEYQTSFYTLPIPDIHGLIDGIKQVNTHFFMFNLADTPIVALGMSLFVPLLAGLSSLLLCLVQNKSNVLQAEQSKTSQFGTLALSVGLSLYLGLFVPSGVAFYWIFGNIFAIIQLYSLNFFISPKKSVDYQALEESRRELQALQNIGGSKKKWYEKDEHGKREREDYKRFFSISNKKLVFYSESSGFYKYFKGIIEEIMNRSNLPIHYITSDPNDAIFELAKTKTQIKPYLIREKKLIVLMMKMDADMVLMTMPDLNNFHIKRSIVRDDVEYVYVSHGVDSLNLTQREGSLANYDTILSTSTSRTIEIRALELLNSSKRKKIVECGYSLIDEMIENYKNISHKENENTKILIAPSWQEENIIDLCLNEILDYLKNTTYEIIVRPHPQQVKQEQEKFNLLLTKYKENKNIEIQTDFSSSDIVFQADLLITDWSGIAFEFSYTTLKPVLFINTPMKIMNINYQSIDFIPINISFRNKIGKCLNLENLMSLNEVIIELLENKQNYNEIIQKILNQEIYNLGISKCVAVEYILNTLKNKNCKGELQCKH